MAESLRDQLSEAFAEVEEQTSGTQAAGTETTAAEPSSASTPEVPEAAVTEQKTGRTAGRARDEHGRLLPGAAKKDSAEQPEAAAQPQVATAQAAAPALAETKKINRPSSWKKDHWEAFDNLAKTNPALAEYINQRESDYAKGVSTYKTEAENAKQMMEAVAPFMPALQANNLQPAQWIKNLGGAHQALVYGDPQTKLSLFAQMARDYKVDLGQLFVRGQDGNIYYNPQLQQAAQQQPQPQLTQADIDKRVDQALVTRDALMQVERMKSDEKNYPHFDTVRPKMIGLLQSGLATSYDDAYQQAIRLDPEIFEAQQEQQRQEKARVDAEAKQRVAEAARRNTVSVKSGTPTAAAAGTNGAKGLRAQLSENFDAATGGRF